MANDKYSIIRTADIDFPKRTKSILKTKQFFEYIKEEENLKKLLLAENQIVFIDVLKAISENIGRDFLFFQQCGNSIILDHNNGQSTIVKIGINSPKKYDYRTNYYRFKISNKLNNYDNAVFVILNKKDSLYFVFKTLDLSRIVTLSLPNKYGAISKYLNRLNNWNILAISIRP